MPPKIFKDNKQEPKKKKPLSEKQLENLAKGRAKRKQKLLDKMNKKSEEEYIKQEKKNLSDKKKITKEQSHQKNITMELEKRDLLEEKNKSSSCSEEEYKEFKKKFTQMKYDLLENTEDPNRFKMIKTYFKSIDLKKFNNVDDVKKQMAIDIEKLNPFRGPKSDSEK